MYDLRRPRSRPLNIPKYTMLFEPARHEPLFDIAWDAEIESVQIEFVRGIQDDAYKAALVFGGEEAGMLRDAVRDHDGHSYDVVFMRIPLGRSWQWSRY